MTELSFPVRWQAMAGMVVAVVMGNVEGVELRCGEEG